LPDWHFGPIQAEGVRRRLGGPTDGVLTELMCVDETEAVRAPSHLDAIEAATLPVAAAAATYRVLYRTSALRPGETLFIQGALRPTIAKVFSLKTFNSPSNSSNEAGISVRWC
jgi:D-arabinose 1-dehydrogenase-like Zn-dependent alcohol dehydrogenase